MTPRAGRLLIGAVVAALAIAALRLPAPRVGRPGELLDPTVVRRWSRADTLGRGETLTALLQRRGFDPLEAANILEATPLDSRRLRAGMTIEVRGDSAGSPGNEVRFFLGVDRIIVARRDEGGEWRATDERLPWTTDTVLIRGTVQSTLYAAIDAGAADWLSGSARQELAWTVADIYEYRVDMSRDLQQGDRLRVVVERESLQTGASRIGRVLAAGLERGGTEVQAIRLEGASGRSRYYDQDGRSLAATFLRAPLSFRRMSSGFGGRRHPVLGTWRAHKGLDYSAASGTPVRTIGDGTVTFAGRRGGYGNVVEVRHINGFVTRYAHLRGFGPAIRSGARVSIGQTIGYVGSTGLSTGPHLHFEVLVRGAHRDPRTALQSAAGPTLSGADRDRFGSVRRLAQQALEGPTGLVRAAVTN
ncbi:MAG: M23 family metallopeptidase [Gemmatimonadota bacterium]|nr:M23 family metallopeptidase [Gemmatimonadota bacterium]MDQ8150306.1 M23 family metallopeptidase [Gemmatimonadota bacterium]MDQ8151898.1 M23 family metallopeptidase [Gemmatimonadota bacterium]MDQ8169507.1 M23 family metallopeptidase [Gemmatimonadota bacterium]MDQ8178346.1 M23 family metallopeptidase [Gemmatimonadota bacterium]